MIDLTKIKKFPIFAVFSNNKVYQIEETIRRCQLDDGPVFSATDSFNHGFFVNMAGNELLGSNDFHYHAVGGDLRYMKFLLVPQAELEEIKKELEETKADRNYFQGELKEVIKIRNNIVTSHYETVKKLEEIEKQNEYFADQITRLSMYLNETICNYLGCDEQRLSLLDEREKLLKELEEAKVQNNTIYLRKLEGAFEELKRDYFASKTEIKILTDKLEATKKELGQLKIEYSLASKQSTINFETQIKKEVDLNNLITHLKSNIEVLTKELEETKKELVTTKTKLVYYNNLYQLNRDLFYSNLQELEATKKELEVTKRSQQEAFNKVEKLISDSPALSSLNEYIMKSFGLKS